MFGKNTLKPGELRKCRGNDAPLILYKQEPQNKESTHNAHGSHMAHASHASHVSSSHVSHYSSSLQTPTKVVVTNSKKITNIDTQKLKKIVSKGSGLVCKDIQVQYGFLQTFQNTRVEQKCYVITITFGTCIYKYYVYGKMTYYFALRNGQSVDSMPLKVDLIDWLGEIVKIIKK